MPKTREEIHEMYMRLLDTRISAHCLHILCPVTKCNLKVLKEPDDVGLINFPQGLADWAGVPESHIASMEQDDIDKLWDEYEKEKATKKEKKCFWKHDWKQYQGFTEAYWYCTVCDEKSEEKPV